MAQVTSEVATPRVSRPLNILIVDDSATMRMVIRRVVDLTEVPIGTIYEANNGLEAITILETCTVHAVFTDINMPVMNGHQLLLEIAQTGEVERHSPDRHLDRWIAGCARQKSKS